MRGLLGATLVAACVAAGGSLTPVEETRRREDDDDERRFFVIGGPGSSGKSTGHDPMSPGVGAPIIGSDMEDANMPGGPPDRLCADAGTPFYDQVALDRGVNVWINDELAKDDVVEYCVSERWARVGRRMQNGKLMMSRGKFLSFYRRNVDIHVKFKR